MPGEKHQRSQPQCWKKESPLLIESLASFSICFWIEFRPVSRLRIHVYIYIYKYTDMCIYDFLIMNILSLVQTNPDLQRDWHAVP